MSKKPLKRGDKKALDNELRAKTARKPRRTEALPPLPPNTIIFCEGTKTEPHYLRSLVDCITERYKAYAMENRISIKEIVKIEGAARSGRTLFEYAKKNLPVGVKQVWLVYDKDDFPEDQFNATPALAEAYSKRGLVQYFTAWSNECEELWLLLHFQDLQSNISREDYTEKLKTHYPDFHKSAVDVYARLNPLTGNAMKRAKALHKAYAPGTTPSDMAPCTTFYKLVEFLREYI